MERTELIERAAKALSEVTDKDTGYKPGTHWSRRAEAHREECRAKARAAFAVFEQAHTPTGDERTWVTGFLLGCGVAPDQAEEYAGKLLAAGFRRPVSPDDYPDAEGLATLRSQEPQAEPSDAQLRAIAR